MHLMQLCFPLCHRSDLFARHVAARGTSTWVIPGCFFRGTMMSHEERAMEIFVGFKFNYESEGMKGI